MILGFVSGVVACDMPLDARARRRWFGGLVLVAAIIMLICGQTVLQGQLKPVVFVLYWILCFVLTGVAMIVAFRDLTDLQQRTRQEHRDLLENTLRDIETEAGAKYSKNRNS